MAYNPFNIFRRNQKALFAVLTVFIMIMFTLSFGSGDFFERFAKWIGSKGKGDAVCKIDGDTVKDGELAKVRRARTMANTFMTLAAGETANYAQNYVDSQQSKLSPEGMRMADAVRQANTAIQFPQYFGGIQGVQQAIFQARMTINATIEDPNAKSEDREAARAFRAMLDLTERRLFSSEDNHFFLNAPNKTSRDTIEFLLWEKKADQLGIRFTKEDVLVLLNREFYGYFKRDVDVRKTMRERVEGFNMDTCLEAIALEFKVRAAQSVILGPPGKVTNSAPVFGTPYEMFEYYRQQCSPATYEVVIVPSLAFTDKVGEPTEDELKELYKKYQEDEPNPAKETFGFKEPRKLSIGWLAITGSEPYYEKLATEQVKVGEVAAKSSGMLTVPLPGTGGGWAMAAVAPLMLKEPAVDAAYSSYTALFRFQLEREYSDDKVQSRDLLPTSTVRPGTMAALLGGMAGQSAPFGHPAVAASIAMGAPMAYEVRDRIKTGLPLLLGAAPGPAYLQTAIGGATSYRLAEPKPLPVEAMRPELLKTTISIRAKLLAHGEQTNRSDPTPRVEKGDITKFVEEMEKLSEKGKPKDKAAIEKYVAEFKAARGLTKKDEQFGSTTAPRDEWAIEEDVGLFPLVIAQKDSLGRARGPHGGNKYVPFGQSFFSSPTFDQATGQMRRVPTSGVYLARPYPPEDSATPREDGRPRYVYWVTEDLQPKKTLNLSTAKDSPVVRDAWKRMKARELAAAHADKIADAIRSNPVNDAVLLPQVVSDQAYKLRSEIPLSNSKAYFRVKSFTLNDVCPLAPVDPTNVDMFQPGASPFGRVQRFRVTESENIPYPTLDIEKALLDNRDKPAKTVVVMTDSPKDTYYVATLIKRELKTPDEFKRNVYSPGGAARNAILGRFQGDTATKARQSVVDLLKKEFKYEETEEQKKKLDDNAKSGGRD